MTDNKTIKSIELNLFDLDIANLYNFFLNSFDLTESSKSSFKVDKYEFQVLKSETNVNFVNFQVCKQKFIRI